VRAEGREYLRRVGPLLLATAVACSAAAFCLTNTLAEPAFEFLLHLMVFVAVGTSLVLGMRGSSGTIVGVVVIAIAVAGVTHRLAAIPGMALIYPTEVIADEDLTWATLWAWLMVGFCFMLARRQNVLFAVVAGLAIYGLIGTVNLNTAVLFGFAVFIFAVVFIWGYEHLLNVGERIPHDGRRGGDWVGVARTQALAGTLLVGVLLAVGLAVGTGLYLVGPRLYVGPGGMMRYARWMQVSLLSYGGSLNDFRVGMGPVNLPAVPAIKVEADYPALWRGAVFDYYTGSGWSRQFTDTEVLEENADGWYVVPGAEGISGTRNRQLVTMLGMEARVLYAAAKPVRARMTDESFAATRLNYRPEIDTYGVLSTSYQMVRGAQYEVISIMPPADAAVLRATPADYPPRIVERYIEQMQVQAEADLGALVAEITANARTPYDKAEAIREFLGGSCLYTTRAPAVPRGEDAASFFALKRRRGACDLFATSLAVMCRLAGVPARVATGFQVGQWDLGQRAFIPEQRDAHAWAEVYTPSTHWVAIDATPPGRYEGRSRFWAALSRGWRSFQRFWNQNLMSYDRAARRGARRWLAGAYNVVKSAIAHAWRALRQSFINLFTRGRIDMALVYLLVAAAVVDAALLAALARRTRRRKLRKEKAATPVRVRFFARLLALLKRSGVEMRDDLTAREQAAVAEARLNLPAGTIRELVDFYYAIRWGRTPVTAEKIRAAEEQVSTIAGMLKR